MRFLLLLFFPLTIVYQFIVFLRNKFFDFQILKTKEYSTKIICVGNIFLGGTGKTPMVEYVIQEYLRQQKSIAVLSRGYGRKSKGFREVLAEDDADKVGDEPLQIKMNFPEVKVFVCEKRKEALDLIHQNFDLIIMDDGFQHRYVKASHYCLLFDYKRFAKRQFWFPSGILREPLSAVKRADSIVISKCLENLTQQDLCTNRFKKIDSNLKVHFSTIKYENIIHGKTNESHSLSFLQDKKVLAFCGIGTPIEFRKFVEIRASKTNLVTFGDHHFFKEKELDEIQTLFEKGQYDLILTTEKDYVRLKNRWNHSSLYFVKIRTQFLGDSPIF